MIPNVKEFHVEGIFKSGLNDYDNIYAIMPLGISQAFFNMKGVVNKLEIFTRETSDVHQTSLEVARALNGKYFCSELANCQ